jgi:Meiotically up-regulated gene 113
MSTPAVTESFDLSKPWRQEFEEKFGYSVEQWLDKLKEHAEAAHTIQKDMDNLKDSIASLCEIRELNREYNKLMVNSATLSQFISPGRKVTVIEPPNYVYAMLNRRNGYIKIGRSREPIRREKILQAEDPDIEILAKREAPASLETELHRHFSEFRLRGEWFHLPEPQVQVLLGKLRSENA